MTTTSPTDPSAPPLLTGLRSIAPRYDLVLCDVWGVVHNGRAAYAPACEALTNFRAQGGVVVLVTNAPRPREPILEQLARLGVPTSAFDALVTSGDVTLAFVAERGEAPLHHIGPERDLPLFETLTRQTGLRPERVPLEQASYVVCTGLNHEETETPDDYAAMLAAMRERDLDLISANPDIIVHVGERLLYCAGALAQRYAAIGGKVFQAGKPFAPIYAKARQEAKAICGRDTPASRVLAIGDAIHTDIKGARQAGFDALFVTSGIHREDLHPGTARGVDALHDPAAFRAFMAGADATPTAAMTALVW